MTSFVKHPLKTLDSCLSWNLSLPFLPVVVETKVETLLYLRKYGSCLTLDLLIGQLEDISGKNKHSYIYKRSFDRKILMNFISKNEEENII